MKRALVILLGALLLAVMLTAAALVFLAATEGGTRFLAGQVERFAPVRFTDVSGAVLREVRVGRIVVELPNQRVEVEGLTTSVEMMPLLFENHLIVHAAKAQAVRLISTGGAGSSTNLPPPALELPYMPLDIDLAELDVARLELPGVFPMRVAGSASWRADGIAVRSAQVTSAVIVGTVTGHLGAGPNPPLTARVNWSLPDRAWGGEGYLDGRVDALNVQHVLRGYVSVNAEGTGSLADVTEPFVDLRATAADLEFGDAAIRAIGGDVRGTPANFSAELAARVEVPGVEPFDAQVVAYGPANGPLTLRNVTADALGGTQDAQGSVSWSDGVRVLLGGNVSDVALGTLREGLDGRVSAGFEFRYQNRRIGLGLGDIVGTLNRRPIGGEMQIVQQDEGWSFEQVRLSVGSNRLSGGALVGGSRVQIDADVDAPALEALGLGIAGDAAGRVQLAGVWPRLDGEVALDSGRLQAFAAELDQVSLRAALNDGTLSGTVTARQATRQQLALRDVGLTASGPLDDLAWELDWADGGGAGRLRRRDDGYAVTVSRAAMNLLDQRWSLGDATRVLLLDDRVEVGAACISGGGASACLNGLVYRDDRIDTTGELERAPVALLRPWLPVQLGETGHVEGRWALSGPLDELDGELSLAARRLSYLVADGEERIDLPDLEVDGELAAGALRLRLAASGAAFNVVGNARAEALRPDASLVGRIEASATDLAPLEVFDQRLEEIAGAVRGALDVTGTVGTPRLQGQMRLSDGRVILNDPGITFTDVAVQLNMDDAGTFELRGAARQEGQELVLTASGRGLFEESLTVYASLEGDGLEARHPDWEVTISPDLDFNYEDGRGRVRGRVTVPEAEVRLTALPTSVPSPSEDVVVVGREQPAAVPSNRLRADVEVVLGDDVVLKAMGITAELEGSLQARLDAQGQTTLRGTLDITGGELTTQGQTLTIESGSVVYNGPVTRPYVDLRAIRVIEDAAAEVTVGLHIRGDADNLTSTVFSEPAMSETRALSFLVLGRDIEEDTAGDDSSRLMAAAINLGLSRSRGITSELMRRTGLDELSAVAEAEDSFAIVAGKRITDDIYVRYTYNTLSAVGAFLVRYELSRRWLLEAQSGEQSAMDLMYSFEK